jgi:acyl-CoA synthetase (AMP-forming)/AMP-acid ligase II
MNTADYLLEHGRDDDVAVLDANGAHTYAGLRSAAARCAGELRALDLKPGDRVGIMGQNSLFWAAAYLATMKLDLVAVPFSTRSSPDEIRRSEEWADCRAIFLDRRQQPRFGAAFRPTTRLLRDDLLGTPAPALWPPGVADDDPGRDAALMFTSGTTARPKAVRVTHGNIQANTDSIIAYLELSREDAMLVVLPFYYCFGTSLLHTHLRVGGRLVLCNNFTFPETSLDLMESAKCTGFAGVPSTFQALLRLSTFARRPLPLLRTIQQAGGKLHDVLIRELTQAKPKARLFVMYGQTEATARLSYLPPDLLPTKLGSIGRGMQGVELRLLDDDGEPVKPGGVGEIVARGANISPGYFNDPEATASKFEGGVLRTGDLATIDADGYISIVDRRDDFIKSWGYRISSQEVESCVLGLPEVVSAAAVGVPSMKAGESVHVFLTLRPGAVTSPDQVIVHCRERLAKHMVPAVATIIKSMPLNSNGKIVKSELRRMAHE